MNKTQVGQNASIAIKLGRIKIKIRQSWSLPFSLYVYQTKRFHFKISQFYELIEILFLNLVIIFCICEE
jgi:hypothetical protein